MKPRTRLAKVEAASMRLPALINRARETLAGATSAAEVLEARAQAAFAYDAAKSAARLAKAAKAHDDIVKVILHAQADALEIDCRAKVRLAEAYDAAQERGEVQGHGGQGKRDISDENIPPTVADIGLSAGLVFASRELRDAEEASPGIIRTAIDTLLKMGVEPSRAGLNHFLRRDERLDARGERRAKAMARAAVPAETRWQTSLHRFAIETVSVPGQMTRLFGEDWRTFEVPPELAALVRDAVETWTTLARELGVDAEPQPAKAEKEAA